VRFSDLLHASVQLRPRFLRSEQAALALGSGEIVADFVGAGWLRPSISEHRLVLYSMPELEKCVRRLEAGEEPIADDSVKRPKPPGEKRENPSPAAASLSFADQLRAMVSLAPLLVRPEQAAAFLGSVELLDEFRKSGWIKPVYSKHKLTIYSVRQLEGCAIRLEAGQRPGVYGGGDEKVLVPDPPVPEMELPTKTWAPKTPRKTRRPMPVDADLVEA